MRATTKLAHYLRKAWLAPAVVLRIRWRVNFQINGSGERIHMIDLELTEDHKALIETVREFAQKEVAPYIKEWDEKQEFHREVFDKMAALNLLGVCLPEEFGGAGFDYISLGLVCEELEAVDTFMRVAMSVHTGLNSLTLHLGHGRAETKISGAAGERRKAGDLRFD